MKFSPQSKRISYDNFNGIADIQEFLAEYLETEDDKTAISSLHCQL